MLRNPTHLGSLLYKEMAQMGGVLGGPFGESLTRVYRGKWRKWGVMVQVVNVDT